MIYDDDTLPLEGEDTLDDVEFVLRTKEGRRFIRRLLTEAKLYEFSPAGLDEKAMLYHDARRDFGVLIISMVNAVDPRAFVTLTVEAAEDAIRAKARMTGEPR